MQEGSPIDFQASSDAELSDLSRQGVAGAYEELWRRHHDSGVAAARRFTSRFDAEDLVSEAHARILAAFRNGRGPRNAFRPYLYTTIRNAAISWSRRATPASIMDPDVVRDDRADGQASRADGELTLKAFRSLPERWQQVLWYTEVEGLKLDEVAKALGIRPNAVAALAYRAREGLRQAWIQAHVNPSQDKTEHQWVLARLGAYLRQRVSPTEQKRIDSHLALCLPCAAIAEEAKHVAPRLRGVLAPYILVSGSLVERSAPSGSADPGPAVLTARDISSSVGHALTVAKMGVVIATGLVLPSSLPLGHDAQQMRDGSQPSVADARQVPESWPITPTALPTTSVPPVAPSETSPRIAPTPDLTKSQQRQSHFLELIPSPSAAAVSQEPEAPAKLQVPVEVPPFAPSPTATPARPSPRVEKSYQAESPDTAAPVIYDCPPCSGKKRAGMIGHGASLLFSTVESASTGAIEVAVDYTNGDATPRLAHIQVNGSEPISVIFEPSGGWDAPSTLRIHLPLVQGVNIISFSNASDWAPDFDRIRV